MPDGTKEESRFERPLLLSKHHVPLSMWYFMQLLITDLIIQ